jgi:hypothetical protein
VAGLALSGLASGVDTSSIVVQLMALEALAVVQAERTATLADARAEVAREIAALPNARGAVAGYAAAQAAAARRRWVNDTA